MHGRTGQAEYDLSPAAIKVIERTHEIPRSNHYEAMKRLNGRYGDEGTSDRRERRRKNRHKTGLFLLCSEGL